MMTSGNPHFEAPHWLWLAVIGPVLLVWLQRYAAARRRRQLASVVSPHAAEALTRSHSPARRWLKEGLLVLSVALLALALARPQWGELEAQDQWLGDDVVFVLDCSRSMLATDIAPTRMQRAKFAIMDFVRRNGRGRVGLVAFAGTAFLQCPLTFDYDAFDEALKEVDERTIPVGGTDIGRALEEAYHGMEKKSARKRIVLLTDGEDLEQGGVKVAEKLAKEGVTIYAIGVGTAAGAELRTLTATGQFDVVRDAKGDAVQSRLDETTLEGIAKATEGGYYPLGRLGEGLAKVRQAIELKNAAGFARTRAQGVERFHVPLAFGLILLVAESLIGTRRGKTTMTQNRKPQAAVAALGLVLLLAAPALANTTTNALTNSVSAGKPPVLESARDYYNVGAQRLTAGKLVEAEAMFQGALMRQDDALQARALYNLGHVRFELGREELKKAPPSQPAKDRSERAADRTQAAIQTAEAALEGNNVQQMVTAYMNGRGAKKEIRGAYDAVYKALEVHKKTLEKWHRSLGDFRGTAELNTADTNAVYNAELVEKAIAKLVDSLRQEQMLAMKCSGAGAKLDGLMKQLKGKIPKEQMPPGAEGEGEEEDLGEPKLEELAGMKEKGSKDGEKMETSLSPEEANNILDGFKLGGNRRLPIGKDGEAAPRDRKLRDW